MRIARTCNLHNVCLPGYFLIKNVNLIKVFRLLFPGMYESSCSYGSALDLKRVGSGSAIKTEECISPGSTGTDWTTNCAYRFACNSTFQQLKQSVEKAKAALQDRNSYLSSATAFGDFSGSPFCNPSRTSNHHTQLDLLPDDLRDDVFHEKRSHSKL